MLQSSLRGLIALLFSCCCWIGTTIPSSAQPTFVSPSTLSSSTLFPFTAEIAMAKPLFSFSGKRPNTVGIAAGKLATCPNTPNCVSSQASESDAEHKIAPIAYQSAPSEAMTKLKSVIGNMERTQIVNETQDYLYAEFTTGLMGFVDDVEFYFDPSTPGQLQVRSASRLGKSDLGVNRKRVEEIRSQFAALEA